MVGSDELVRWHERLQRHYTDLRAARSAVGVARPLFALEHGLDSSESLALSNAIRHEIARGAPWPEVELPWVVYATEVGYRYSGDEYWQTFEAETPGWTRYGDRNWIRDCFQSFERAYGGAKPSGPWAKHFTIICWPITHAILPRDLQRQLARILYELRHTFSAELFDSHELFGEAIAGRSWNTTSRFQNLVQEQALVGQIAAALLLEGEPGTGSLIHPATLQRISADLAREQQGREWLLGARRMAKERARVRGLAPWSAAPASIRSREDAVRQEIAALGIEPRVLLRPTTVGGGSWDVLLELPDLSHLLSKFPRSNELLNAARCVVAGAAGPPLARGALLHGPRRVLLKQWPRPDEMLLSFDQRDVQFEYLLRTDCLLRPGNTWLFRVAADGFAYEVRTLRARAGERYIVLNSRDAIATTELGTRVDLRCDGASAVLLDVPPALTEDWEATFRRLGVRHGRTIEVWPAGLASAAWDGEGTVEWRAFESPCLAVRCDHPVDAIALSLDDRADQRLELTPVTPGVPAFVELPRLSVGIHTIRVDVRVAAGAAYEARGFLTARIRDRRLWSPEFNRSGPMLVDVTPSTPSLEELWEGLAQVEIRGPSGRSVKCVAALMRGESEQPMVSVVLPPLALPVGTDRWKTHFEKHFRQARKVQEAYDGSRACRIEFAAEELGRVTLRCERLFAPLRWSIRREEGRAKLYLIDDTGVATEPDIARFTFDAPTVRQVLPPSQSFELSGAGGLYIATRAQFAARIIAMPVVRDLTGLRCTPRIDRTERSSDRVKEALEVAALWRVATPSGSFLASTNQQVVMRALARHVIQIIGGEVWATAEERAGHEDTADLGDLKLAVSRRADEIGVAVAIVLQLPSLAASSVAARVAKLAELITSFRLVPKDAMRTGTGDPRWLAELALRLASDPAVVRPWSGKYTTLGIERLMDAPTIARAARFLVLAVNKSRRDAAAPDELYATWAWQ